jgi:hypothetical protein
MYRGFLCGWAPADSDLRLYKYAKDKKPGINPYPKIHAHQRPEFSRLKRRASVFQPLFSLFAPVRAVTGFEAVAVTGHALRLMSPRVIPAKILYD